MTFRIARLMVNCPQRLAFGCPRGIEVKRIRIVVGGGDAVMQRIDLCPVVRSQLAVLCDLLGADIRDIQEAA